MPTYQYECSACHHHMEAFQSMMEKRLSKCPQCGKNKLERLIGSGTGIIFKGKGFYETDYKKKDAPKPSESKSTKEAVTPKNAPGPCGSNCGCHH